MKSKGATENFRESYEHGLIEGSDAGQKIRAWLDDGIFPPDGNVLFKTMGVKLRQENSLLVDMLRKSAKEGDTSSKQLLDDLNISLLKLLTHSHPNLSYTPTTYIYSQPHGLCLGSENT